MWIITIDVNLDHLAEVVFVTFLYCEATLAFLFYNPTSHTPHTVIELHFQFTHNTHIYTNHRHIYTRLTHTHSPHKHTEHIHTHIDTVHIQATHINFTEQYSGIHSLHIIHSDKNLMHMKFICTQTTRRSFTHLYLIPTYTREEKFVNLKHQITRRWAKFSREETGCDEGTCCILS